MERTLDELRTQERVVRTLVCGGRVEHQELANVLGPSSPALFWQAGYLELFPRVGAALDADTITQRLPASLLWRIEPQASRGTLEVTILTTGRDQQTVRQRAAQSLQSLLDDLQAEGWGATAGLGSPVTSLDALPTSFQEARLVSGYAVARGGGLFFFDREKELLGLSLDDLGPFPERLSSALLTSTPVGPVVDEFFRVLATTKASVRRLHLDILNVFSRVANLLPSTPAVEAYYRVLDVVHEPVQLRVLLNRLCASAVQRLEVKSRSLADRKAREFEEHVAQNFMNFDLNITDVGRALQISPSYLAKLLRRNRATTFVEFVTEYRMNRARELLSSTDLMTYEIAEAVGYPYTHYFSANFKKHVGTTPSEFRALTKSGRGLVAVVS